MTVYKVEVEEIENKLNLINKSRKDALVKFVMVATGAIVLLYLLFDENKTTYVFTLTTFFFLQAFALYYYIHPIVGKLELLERDIQNLKQVVDVKDEVHY